MAAYRGSTRGHVALEEESDAGVETHGLFYHGVEVGEIGAGFDVLDVGLA